MNLELKNRIRSYAERGDFLNYAFYPCAEYGLEGDEMFTLSDYRDGRFKLSVCKIHEALRDLNRRHFEKILNEVKRDSRERITV